MRAELVEREDTKAGASLNAFIAGHVGTVRIQPTSGRAWSGTCQQAHSNAEAVRRLLTAALLWLDGNDLMVAPALHGKVFLSPRSGEPER